MTTAQESALFTAGIAPVDAEYELGAAHMYATIDNALVAWLPSKAARQHGENLTAIGIEIRIVAAPKRDRTRTFEPSHCPGF